MAILNMRLRPPLVDGELIQTLFSRRGAQLIMQRSKRGAPMLRAYDTYGRKHTSEPVKTSMTVSF
jgi:hypothetical protein